MRKLTTIVCISLALTACVRSNTKMLDPSTAIISARGTAFDDTAGVMHATLTEAAKTAKARGFRYFGIVAAKDATSTAQIYTPGSTHTSGSVYGVGNTAYYNASSYTTPGTWNTFVRPGADVIIRMFKESEVPSDRRQELFDADAVLSVQPKK